MTSLVVISKASSTIAGACLDLLQGEYGRTIFVSLNSSSTQFLQNIGISPIVIDPQYGFDWELRDRKFAELALPGALDGIEIEGFPIWKSLSLDRLSFWFNENTGRVVDLLTAFKVDHIYVSLDIDNPVIWQIATKGAVMAIQADSVLTREFADLAPYLPFEQIMVRDKISGAKLQQFGYGGPIGTHREIWYPDQLKRNQTKGALDGLGLAAGVPVSVVLYDPQQEWAFRRWLALGQEPGVQYVVLVAARRAREILAVTIPGLPYIVTEDMMVLTLADEVINFAYEESISRSLQVPVKTFDIKGRFLSALRAHNNG